MIYAYAVKAYGKFYPAGAEVPEENPDSAKPAGEKPKTTKKEKGGG